MQLIQNIPKLPGKLIVVGEAPGADEIKYNKPFIGYEGIRFRKAFKAAGADLDTFYVTNTVHIRPFKNNYNSLKSADIAIGRKQLESDLVKWQAKGATTILAVGKNALEMLTDKKGIEAYRGAVMPCSILPTLKVVATVHPGFILQGGSQGGRYEPIQILDIIKAIKESSFVGIRYPERNIETIHDETQAIELLSGFTNTTHPLACDIETNYGSLMTAYGIAISPKKAYSITRECLTNRHVLRALSQFCFSSTPKIFHNALFDCLHNAYHYKIINYNIFCDTLLAQHAIYPTLLKSLAFCASIYTNEPYWKDDTGVSRKAYEKGLPIDWDQLYIYNGKDCCLTYEIYEKQQREIDEWGSRGAYNIMMSLIQPCLFAMMRGTKIDLYKLGLFKKDNEKAIEVLEQVKTALFGSINVNSHKQLKELIYDSWDLPKQYKGKKLTTDDKKLNKLERFPTPYQPFIGLFRTMKKNLTKRNFYSLELNKETKLGEDKSCSEHIRIRTALKIHGTYTGRFASAKSIFGTGKNLLNIPKETRSFYVADKGKIFIQGDLSQAEARIVAACCKDYEWLKAFDETDIHKEVAAALFHTSYDDVTKAQRTVAKRIEHGTHYGLGKILLSEILICSPKEAQQHKDAYHALRPRLRIWQNGVKTQVRRTRTMKTVFGRVIQFFGPFTDKMFRDAVASEPQSTSADYLNSGLAKIYNRNLPYWEFLLSVYDSILCQVPDELSKIKETIAVMKELTEIPITINDLTFTIPMDFEIGYSWRDVVEIENNDIEKAYEQL